MIVLIIVVIDVITVILVLILITISGVQLGGKVGIRLLTSFSWVEIKQAAGINAYLNNSSLQENNQ